MSHGSKSGDKCWMNVTMLYKTTDKTQQVSATTYKTLWHITEVMLQNKITM